MEAFENNFGIMDRRDFIKKSAIVGAGGLALGSLGISRLSGASANNEIGVALIGTGPQGQVLLNSLKNIPGLRFHALCDIWDYNLRKGMGALRATGQRPNTYENFEEMLEKETGVDAVIVATPDFWHAPHTIASLQAGKHVYCEKMMSNTLEGAKSMVLAARESGKLLQIGHQRRSNPRYRFVKDRFVDKAKLAGRIVNINGQWNRSLSRSQDITIRKASLVIPTATLKQYGYNHMQEFLNWRWYKALSGGPISDLGAHQIDVFNWFLDAVPSAVTASGGRDYFVDREHFDNVMTIFEYDTPQGRTRAFYQVLTTTSAGGGYYESFMGTEGTINISENPNFTKIYREPEVDLEKWKPLVSSGLLKQDSPEVTQEASSTMDVRESAPLAAYDLPVVMNKPAHQPHLENFFGAIRGEAELTCDAEHAYRDEYAIYHVNEAAEKNQRFTFKPEDFLI
jgi:predicted dehydrogenase